MAVILFNSMQLRNVIKSSDVLSILTILFTTYDGEIDYYEINPNCQFSFRSIYCL